MFSQQALSVTLSPLFLDAKYVEILQNYHYIIKKLNSPIHEPQNKYHQIKNIY